MMFLTTNQVSQIDNTIASRIHFKLKYDNLKAITPQGAPICSRSAFESLVGKERNGREVGASFTCPRNKLITAPF